MPRSSTFIAIVAILVSTSRAGLGFPSSRLTYIRAAGTEACPNEAAVRRAVAARLGYDPFFPSADKTIVTRITRARETLHASVELVDDNGMVRGIREFDAAADQCEELVAAAALAISIAIDPTNPSILGGAPPPKAPVPEKAPDHPPAQLSPEPTQEAERRAGAGKTGPDASTSRALGEERKGLAGRSSSEASFAVRPGIAVIGALRTAPAAAIGFGAFLELRQGDLSIGLEGRFDLPASTSMSEGGRLRTSLWVGSVLPCFHASRFFVCATGSVGSLGAESLGLTNSRTNNTFYAGLGVRIGLEIPLTERLFLRPQLDVVGALFPAELQVDRVTRWTAPPYAILAGIGLGARFP
jgi:hypothetical protein